MNVLLKIVFVVSALKAALVFLLLVGAIMLWISSIDNILFPGIGIVIAIPMFIILLVTAEILLITITLFTWRYISKVRLQ
jgi:hypothetical protein